MTTIEVFAPEFPPLVTYRQITLEKVIADAAPAALGDRYTYSYKSLTRGEALSRASKALARDHKGEDRMHWQEIG